MTSSSAEEAVNGPGESPHHICKRDDDRAREEEGQEEEQRATVIGIGDDPELEEQFDPVDDA